jgi:transcriptional regulator with XRE-family HTH domain
MGRRDKPVLSKNSESISIGKQMRQSRQAKGISLTDMAGRLSYSLSYLSGVENCHVQPSSRLIADYEKILEHRLDSLIDISSTEANTSTPYPYSLEILKQGPDSWNSWREEHQGEYLPLANIDLSKANLKGINFSQVSLCQADLSETDLRISNLSEADLRGANLSEADLRGADLRKANLYWADLSEANLSEADLRGADLRKANLIGAELNEAELSEVTFGWTSIGNTDLRRVKGLETIQHNGPSTIGLDAIYRSQGDIPESFLRGTGISDTFLEYMRALTNQPIEYYTCFISYASKDQALAERLYADLQSKGVRCWYAPEDMKIGDNIRHRIDESIRLYDKLLLILSEHSISNPWVKHEVDTALEKEDNEKRIVLFPIRLDETVMQSTKSWAAHLRRTRHIGDFTGWKEHDKYQGAFIRLLRDISI